MTTMIPKVIHYCWFGRGAKPRLALKCIASWKQYMPDYEIREWNEDNYDVNHNAYTARAYAARKYAYVSDYARMWILYNEGGLYFDTDVELVAPLDDIVAQGPFMGIEGVRPEGDAVDVNPGLGLGACPGLGIYEEILQLYEKEGLQCRGYIVPFATQVMKQHGIAPVDALQVVDGITVYPHDYFNPYDYITGQLNTTANTRTIHWYGASWLSPWGRMKLHLGRQLRRLASR